MIQIQGANFGHDQPLLKEIDLDLKSGQLIMLCGENGSGKSTFINSIAGKIDLLKGAIKFNGQINTRAERDGIVSICYPLINAYGNLSFLDLVMQGRSRFTNIFDKPSEQDKSVVNKHMTELGINHLKEHQISRASDGERQKALLARALSTETPIILLDEPTAFLDYPSKKMLMKMLKKVVSENNRLVIFTSHDLELCRPFVDDLLLIQDQSIISSEHPNFESFWQSFIQ